MFNKSLIALAALATMTTASSAEVGHTFWNANGLRSTIVVEEFWQRNGYTGFDAVIVEEFSDSYSGNAVTYGVVCLDEFHRDIGPAVRRMNEYGSVEWSQPVVPYSARMYGQAGYAQDLWHNVCLNKDNY